ncbi:MAG: hypothetical protein ACJ71T_01175 [Actinomycetales bacterium]
MANADGYVWRLTGTAWTGPVRVDVRIDSLDCPSTTLCFAIDALGAVARWDGTTWHAPTPVLDAEQQGLVVETVSCASTTFCVAISPDRSAVWNGGAWSASSAVVTYPADMLLALSCPAVSWCAAMDVLGRVWTTTTGRSWAAGPGDGFYPTGLGTVLTRRLECVAKASCLAMGMLDLNYVGQDVRTFNGQSWSAVTVVDPYDAGELIDISCPTTTFCAVVDQQGYAVVWQDGVWRYPRALQAQVENAQRPLDVQVECPAKDSCVAADNSGNAWTYDGTTWTATGHIGSAQTSLEDLSCPTISFCMAWGGTGIVSTWHGSSWQRMANTPTDIGATTCGSSTYCLGFTADGVRTWNGATWGATIALPISTSGNPVSDCAGPGDCLAVAVNRATQLNGTHWSASFAVPPGRGPAICVGSQTCYYLAGSSQISLIVSAKIIHKTPDGLGFSTLDCVKRGWCAIGAVGGTVLVGDPAALG